MWLWLWCACCHWCCVDAPYCEASCCNRYAKSGRRKLCCRKRALSCSIITRGKVTKNIEIIACFTTAVSRLWILWFYYWCLYLLCINFKSLEVSMLWDLLMPLSLCLCQEFVQFFRETLDRKVCWSDRLEFINGWYILLIISDILTITGSVIKIGIESKVCPMSSLSAIICY